MLRSLLRGPLLTAAECFAACCGDECGKIGGTGTISKAREMSPIKRTRHAVYDLKYHFVWTPKYRKQILKGDVAEFIEATMRRIADEYEWVIDELAVQPDHVHVFIQVGPRYAPAQVVQIIKSITAREVFEQFPQLRKRLWAGKFWGQGILFAVSAMK